MTAVKLVFELSDPATLYAAGYTQIKIEKSTDGGSVWNELSRSTTRLPIRDVVEKYAYSDSNGATTYDYRATPYNPATDTDDSPVAITDIEVDSYATVAEIRAEGVTVTEADDARVELALTWATRYIERLTRRVFGFRYAVQRIDITASTDTILLEEPLIALLYMTSGNAEVDLDTLEVYNRHLRGGEMADLSSPMLKISDDLDSDVYYRIWQGAVGFDRGSMAVVVKGIWGYTEPTRGAIGGDTEEGSQVPLDYGIVPPLINWACRALTLQHLFPMYDEDDMSARSRQVKELKTRDQWVKFSDTAADSSSGWASNDAVMEVLMGYGKSISFGSP